MMMKQKTENGTKKRKRKTKTCQSSAQKPQKSTKRKGKTKFFSSDIWAYTLRPITYSTLYVAECKKVPQNTLKKVAIFGPIHYVR